MFDIDICLIDFCFVSLLKCDFNHLIKGFYENHFKKASLILTRIYLRSGNKRSKFSCLNIIKFQQR